MSGQPASQARYAAARLVYPPHPFSASSLTLGLLARLFDPDSGKVLLGGEPLRELSLDSLHECVRLVSPELPLLRGTVRTNLAYGSEGDASEPLLAAAELCGLSVPGPGLPEGLETPVQEQGEGSRPACAPGSPWPGRWRPSRVCC